MVSAPRRLKMVTKKKLDVKKLEVYFRQRLKKILECTIEELSIGTISGEEGRRLHFRIEHESFTFDNLVKISKLTGSKDINIGSETEGGGPCTCGGYCYCTGPHAFVTISAALTDTKISEILGT